MIPVHLVRFYTQYVTRSKRSLIEEDGCGRGTRARARVPAGDDDDRFDRCMHADRRSMHA